MEKSSSRYRETNSNSGYESDDVFLDDSESYPREPIHSSPTISEHHSPGIEDGTADVRANSVSSPTFSDRDVSPKKLFGEMPHDGNSQESSKAPMSTERKQSINDTSSDDSVLLVDEDSVEVIDVSSGDEVQVVSNVRRVIPPNPGSKRGVNLIQPTLVEMLSPKTKTVEKKVPPEKKKVGNLLCTSIEYENEIQKLNTLKQDLLRTHNTLRTLNVDVLPDKGMLLKKRASSLGNAVELQEAVVNSLIESPVVPVPQPKVMTWSNLQKRAEDVKPAGFGGKTAMSTYNIQKSLTMDKLKVLHDSLASQPGEDVLVEDPEGLVVSLMPHQQHALAFLIWREGQKPSGGILADDMGLGKTLTMISLILKSNQMEKTERESSDENSDQENEDGWIRKQNGKRCREYYPGKTLVVCPASLLNQWESEVQKRCRRGVLSVDVYHGNNREIKPRRLAKFDLVVTTYNLVGRENETRGPLFGVKWERIILDEAHVVRNPKSKMSLGVCALKSRHRWCLTGTPVQNKEMDMFALLKFLKCTPFNDIMIWKKWVDNKSAGGHERLNLVVKSLMLRRTKTQLKERGQLTGLPAKSVRLIEVTLSSDEKNVYNKILVLSRSLFAQFLHQRAEKNTDLRYAAEGRKPIFLQQVDPNSEYHKIHRNILKNYGGGEQVKSHEILVLLLRLRQICCHPALVKSMLDVEVGAAEGIQEVDGSDLNLLDQLEKLKLDAGDPDPVEPHDIDPQHNNGQNLATAASKLLNPSHTIFNEKTASAKIKSVISSLQSDVLKKGDKAIVVSQWTSMLRIIRTHLNEANIASDMLSGEIPVNQRMGLVDQFNREDGPQVLLLSLTAGGVGLNLVGGNHLFLIDLHWNPQLEAQAQDRIYRVGQTKPVNIYKFVALDTIEERIKALQDNKLAMAASVLTGAKQTAGSQLSIEDLKMLFGMTG